MNEDRFPIDDALASMISDLRQGQLQLQGALTLFLRQHKLEGNWQIDEQGRELVRVTQEVRNA